jgi:hypothetical protein
MNVLRLLTALAVLLGVARTGFADEDDDDPKSAHRPVAVQQKKSAAPVVAAKTPVAPEPAAKKAIAAPAPAPALLPPRPAAKPAAAPAPPAMTDAKKPPEPSLMPLPPAIVPATHAPRNVRVRLLDGSSVVGQVRAEQSDALVIDCALGELAIPRARIAIIAYDAAAGVSPVRHSPSEPHF